MTKVTFRYAGISVEVDGYYMGLSNNIGNLDEEAECPVVSIYPFRLTITLKFLQANIKKLVGVRTVIDSIIELKVPVVVHNGLLGKYPCSHYEHYS